MDVRQLIRYIFMIMNIFISITGLAYIIYGVASSQPIAFLTYSYVGAQVATVGSFYMLFGLLGIIGGWQEKKEFLYTYLHFSLSLFVLRILDWIFWSIQGMYINAWYHFCFFFLELVLTVIAFYLYNWYDCYYYWLPPTELIHIYSFRLCNYQSLSSSHAGTSSVNELIIKHWLEFTADDWLSLLVSWCLL